MFYEFAFSSRNFSLVLRTFTYKNTPKVPGSFFLVFRTLQGASKLQGKFQTYLELQELFKGSRGFPQIIGSPRYVHELYKGIGNLAS